MQEEKAFGETLRLYRRKAGMSQEKLAFESGLTRNYVSLLENGQKSPSLRSMFKLCATLNVSPALLIEEVCRRLADIATD